MNPGEHQSGASGSKRNSLRVLHIINSLGPGGAETQLAYLATGLRALNVEVDIAYFASKKGGAQNQARLEAAGAHLHRLSAKTNHDPRLFLQIRKLIREIEPDVVQTWLTMMDVFGGAAARSLGRPWILSERNAEPESIDSTKMRVRRVLARGASAIVANSRAGQDLWRAQNLGEASETTACEVIPNALPLGEVEATRPIDREQHGISSASPLVIFAGRLEPQKNIENLLPALEKTLHASQATALLFGQGQLEPEIEEFIREKGLDGRLRFGGFTTELWSWIRVCDVFVSVSHYEGMPNAVMEAMALGRPVVVSDIPQHREICDESTALLVDRESPDAIAQAILRCLDDPESAVLRARAARTVALDWTIEAAASKYEGLYRTVLTKGPSV